MKEQEQYSAQYIDIAEYQVAGEIAKRWPVLNDLWRAFHPMDTEAAASVPTTSVNATSVNTGANQPDTSAAHRQAALAAQTSQPAEGTDTNSPTPEPIPDAAEPSLDALFARLRGQQQ